ncbi:hypothetical protein KY347_04290 [Candidatus Woesearchaeota archaeon]|nr:hypothetical protein [Candidatus Woesearchaeota archaeon]
MVKIANAPAESMRELAKRMNAPAESMRELAKRMNAPAESMRELAKRMNASIDITREMIEKIKKTFLPSKTAFLLYQSYGFPIEMIKELAKEKNIPIDINGFNKEFDDEFKKHQELSRTGAEKRFKGGLADSSEETTKLHTATHLLNEALRAVLKNKDISQKGSNITPERLRFDFNFDRKLTKEELQKAEDWVNERIKEEIPVIKEELTIDEATKKGAHGVFGHKYGDKVFVYSIGDKSVEICGGPHVKNTKELGRFRIKKEESSAAGIRRIKAVLE